MSSRRFSRFFSFRRHRPWLLASVFALTIAKIIALSPSSVDQPASSTKSAVIDPSTLLMDHSETLATGIPKDRVPEYTVDRFQYVSTQNSEKQWKLQAHQAFLFHEEKLVHARQIHAYLFDPDGKITVVTGKEAKYFMNKRDLEIYGDVVTVFPDGFELKSEYLRYKPGERKIEIPEQYFTHGSGHEKSGQSFQFESRGLDYNMALATITLPQSVKFTVAGPSDPTTITSDRAVIQRDKQVVRFTMNPSRPVDSRFVQITQPTLFTRSRRADLNYGDYSKLLNSLTTYEDVLIKETGGDNPSLRYATGGRAEFDTRSDIIRLTEFPQAYQDNDTVTGDIIIFHRNSDLVEVEHSNAFSQGN